MGSLSGTGVAARAQGTKTTAPGLTLREARQQQKFRQINSNDNAATTTRLVNPPAAVIPNPAGVGGEAGAQGAFGSMSGGAAPQGAYGGSYNPTVPITGTAAPVVIGAGAGPRDRNGVVNTPPPSAFQQIWDVYSNPNTYIDPFMPSNNVGTNRRVASGDAQGLFPGVQAGGGAVNQGTAANQNAQGYFAQQPYTGTAGYSAAYNQQQNIGFNNPHPSRGGTQPTYGPAGYMSPNQPQQPNYGPASYMSPNQPQQAQTSTGMKPPAANITAENYAQWQAYWNWQAQHPGEVRAQITADAIAKGKPDPFAPVVMTREQIWQMKANQRRKIAARATADDLNAIYNGVPVIQPSPYSGYTGNYYSTVLNTGTG